MSPRHESPKPRGKITAPVRRSEAGGNDALTIDDIPNVLHTTSNHQQDKLHLAPPKQTARPAPKSTASQAKPSAAPRRHSDLASQRAALGFDDIPVASHEEILKEKARRERAGTWAKEAYNHSVSATKDSRFAQFIKGKTFSRWKDDLKWAMDADQGTDERKKKQPANTVADIPARRHRTPPVITPATETTKTIDINISFGELPKLPSPKSLLNGIRRFQWKRLLKIMTGVVVVIGIFAAILFLSPAKQLLPSSHNEGPALPAEQSPNYQTILPAGKSASSFTWQRVSPPNRDPVFAYSDMIDNIKIAVSQQPVPDDFKPNIEENVANLAKNYAATDKVTAGDTQLYVGTSGQGPQSVIFTKNGLLVLIKSSSKVPDAAWARYVESLQYSTHY